MLTKPTAVFLAVLLVSLVAAPCRAQKEPSGEARQFMSEGIGMVDAAKSVEDLNAAARSFEKATAAAPEWPDPWYNLGKVLSMSTGSEEKAIAALGKYLSLSPDAPDAEAVREDIRNVEKTLKLRSMKEFTLKALEFSALPDGIYLTRDPGSRLLSRVFHRGDKVVAINRIATKGMGLDTFYKIMTDGDPKEEVRFDTIRGGKESSVVVGRGFLFTGESGAGAFRPAPAQPAPVQAAPGQAAPSPAAPAQDTPIQVSPAPGRGRR
jgi:hypothetical protein